jgi:DNA polymerase III delta prime subunit
MTVEQLLPGYSARIGEIMAAKYLRERTDHFRAALFVGDPGTGKTFFAECLARGLDAAHYFIPCHPWLTAEEVHQGVDIGAVAVGVENADDAYLDGQLLKAVRESQHRDVVVTLDEVEKAGSRFYPLILDFLQNGRVHDARHRLHVGNPRNLFVVLTANEGADIPDAVKRRCFRVVMQFLPENVESDVLRKSTGAPGGACRLVVAMATAIRQYGESKPSMQELRELLRSRYLATNVDEVDALIDAFLIKDAKDRQAVQRRVANPAATLLGEFRRDRG